MKKKKRKKKRENTHQRKIISHKTIFMWFGNLPTSTELQGFHYYQGKKYKVLLQFFLSLKKHNNHKNPNHKITFSTSCAHDSQWATKRAKKIALSISTLAWAYQPKPSLHGLNLKKSPIKNHATLFGSSWVIKPDQTKLGSTMPNIVLSHKWLN